MLNFHTIVQFSFNLVQCIKEPVRGYPINAALHNTMRRNGYQRYGQVQDDYLQDMDIYVKSATYTIKEQLPFPWE